MSLSPTLPGASCYSIFGVNDRQWGGAQKEHTEKGKFRSVCCLHSELQILSKSSGSSPNEPGRWGQQTKLEAGAYLIAPAAAKCLAQFPPLCFSVIGTSTCFIFQLKCLGTLPSLPLSFTGKQAGSFSFKNCK